MINKLLILLFLGTMFWLRPGNAFSQSYLISQGGTVNTCSGTFYDSGGASGNYNNSENYTFTICSNLPGATVVVTFTSFSLESNFDYLTIYNGPNTSSPALITNASGTSLNGQSFESVGGTCLTFRFTSDGSVTYAGWAATISCGFSCQPFTVEITGTNPPISPPADSLWIGICQGESITFTATGNFPNSGQNYNQTNANTQFIWTVTSASGSEQFSGLGMTSFTHTFNEGGGYFINLLAQDANSCTASILHQYRVRVSLTPNFVGVGSDVNIVCPYETVNLSGAVTSNSWVMPITSPQVGPWCVTDDQGVQQEFCWTVNAYQPGQIIANASDVQVCLSMEHSFLGDIEMYIRCPNGTMVLLHEFLGVGAAGGCGGTDLGVPISVTDCNPGTCWDYCFTSSASQTWQQICGGVSAIPAGNYLPAQSFNNLVGCPINGEWCVVVIDDWGIDDGTLCNVDLQFNTAIPSNSWTITHTYDPNDLVWTGNGVAPNSGGTAVANPTTPGNQVYTFTATDDFGCSYTSTVNVTVRPFNDPLCCVMPDPNAGADELVCTDTYTFNPSYTDGNTFNWEQVSGPGTAVWANQTSPNATVSVSQYGVYVFRFTEQNLSPACAVSDDIQIAFWPVPQSSFAASPVACAGDISIITYTGNASAAASYTWDFAGGNIVQGSGQGPYHIIWDNPGNHAISLQVTEHTCTSVVTELSLYSPPVLDANPTITDDPCYQSCNGSATLNVLGGTPPYNYSWASSTNYLPNLCAADYVVTVTDVNNCESIVNFTISSPTELVKLDTAYSNISCYQANDGVMSITVEGGVPPYNYVWSDFGPNTHTRTGMPAGNYAVTVFDAHGCTVFEMFQLSQPAELQVVLSTDMSICEGQTVNVNAQAMGGTLPYRYYWDTGNGFALGPPTLTVTPLETTVYSVYVVDGHDCVSPTRGMTITVSPLLQIVDIDITHNRCYHSCDGRAELNVVGGIPPLSYSWSSPIHILNNLCAGIYTITVTDQIGCFAHSYFEITEPDTLNYSMQTQDANCFGGNDGTATVQVTGGTMPYNYLWPNNATSQTINSQAGNYVMTVTDAHNCRIEAHYSIGQPNELVIQPIANPYICIGQTATVAAQAAGGTPYYNFSWQGDDGSSFSTHLFHVSPETTTQYTVSVTDANGCTATPATVSVIVHPPIQISSVTTSTDTVCQGERAVINVDVIGGNGGPYEMTLNNTALVGSPFTVNPTFTQTFYISATDMCGSPPDIDSITITVIPFPENQFTVSMNQACAPAFIQFNETASNDGDTYFWDFGDDDFAQIRNPMHVYIYPGIYSVTLTVTNPFGCSTTRSHSNMITVHPKPTSSFYLEPEIATMLESEISFTNLSQNAMQYYWYFGDGDSSLFVHPRHQYRSPGEFEVLLVAESDHQCKDTTKRTVYIENVLSFYAPETFTPNGDGVNDCFRVCGQGIDPHHFTLSVYDRWGNHVYHTNTFNPETGCHSCSNGSWDGTRGDRMSGDKTLPIGLYTWYCEFKDVSNITHKKSGVVRLIR